MGSLAKMRLLAEPSLARRALLFAATAALSPTLSPAWSAGDDATLSAFVDKEFGYQLSYPSSFKLSNKPVKTHLSEAVLKSPLRGVQLGITVDPVRIGTLEEVTQRVLAVEETRDGVTDVKLRAASQEAGPPLYYTIEYRVESTRGKKVYLCKYSIAPRPGRSESSLYVLQAQAYLDTFDSESDAEVRQQLQSAVSSFKVGS